VTTVTLRNVRQRFGRTTALDDVSLDLDPGITGLLGPNGAGKTTLLRLVATVLGAEQGQLRLLDRDPSDDIQRTAIRRHLGYLPQEPGFHRQFTAFEFVDYVAILKEWTQRQARHVEVRRVLEIVGLGDVAGKRIKALSGGMRRRVALAQALLGDPSLLVLDEPTAGLDPEQRLRFRELISTHGDPGQRDGHPNAGGGAINSGRTVVLSTHQTEDVAALCGRVVVLDAGRVRFTGTPAELAGQAAERVWVAAERSAGARLAWRTGDGRHRCVGDPPAGAEMVAPTLEDGYLLLLGERALAVTA
jgi:ABC-2 type transport system ATP-binding protein